MSLSARSRISLPISRSSSTDSGEANTLRDELDTLAAPGQLFEREGDSLRCHACAHRCKLKQGQHGLCGVRFNKDGQMYAPRGYISRDYVRPVEQNTMFHVRPGSMALTYGMYGCDLRCGYCHNWYLSQALREETGEMPVKITARELVRRAVASGADVLCAGYNEPLISTEWLVEIFKAARKKGLTTMVTSDGNTTPEVLDFIQPFTDAIRIDLKAYDDIGYRKLGGRFAPVVEAIKYAYQAGFFVEVVTLVTRGLNDNLRGLRSIAQFLASLDRSIPWHLNLALPRYKHQGNPVSVDLLNTAAKQAREEGLQYVYTSNMSPEVAQSDTKCLSCGNVTVRRINYATRYVRQRCSLCGTTANLLWDKKDVKSLRDKMRRRRQRRLS